MNSFSTGLRSWLAGPRLFWFLSAHSQKRFFFRHHRKKEYSRHKVRKLVSISNSRMFSRLCLPFRQSLLFGNMKRRMTSPMDSPLRSTISCWQSGCHRLIYSVSFHANFGTKNLFRPPESGSFHYSRRNGISTGAYTAGKTWWVIIYYCSSKIDVLQPFSFQFLVISPETQRWSSTIYWARFENNKLIRELSSF